MCDKAFFEAGVWILSVGISLIITTITVGSTLFFEKTLPVVYAQPVKEIKLKF